MPTLHNAGSVGQSSGIPTASVSKSASVSLLVKHHGEDVPIHAANPPRQLSRDHQAVMLASAKLPRRTIKEN
jgi:hypothetical protein